MLKFGLHRKETSCGAVFLCARLKFLKLYTEILLKMYYNYRDLTKKGLCAEKSERFYRR